MTSPTPSPLPAPQADWESFYASYRKPGYVPGFEITSKLGGGMSGLVFKATRQSIGKDYAIKFLRVEDESVRRAVLQELEQVRFFAAIDHPNLVAIEDKGEVDGIPYLVMAFAGGETLQSRLRMPQVDRGELLLLFLQACRGVAALHERGLVHFDLKPANVFLKGNVARVGDYGLSRLVAGGRGSLSMGRGTPFYMAPEMLQRRGDHRSDVYSLGVVLYEILAGDVPFRGTTEWEVLKQHETAALAFPSWVDARHRAVVERAMAKDPAQRFQSVHDLVLALGAPIGVGAAACEGPPATPATAATAATTPRAASAAGARAAGGAAPTGTGPRGHDARNAAFRDASKQAAAHAARVAGQAMAHARRQAHRAVEFAQRAMHDAMQRRPRSVMWRAKAWQRLHRLRQWQRRRDRELRRAARRAARRGGGTLGWIVLGVVFASILWPNAFDATPAAPTVATASVPVPDGPRWVELARSSSKRARTELQEHLRRFEAKAPLQLAERVAAQRLPEFGPVVVSLDSRSYGEMARLADELASGDEYDEQVAKKLARYGRQALLHCAMQLERDPLEGGRDRTKGERLGRFLAEQTGYCGIPLFGEEVPITMRVDANSRFGTLWRWWLAEFAPTDRCWQVYRTLAR